VVQGVVDLRRDRLAGQLELAARLLLSPLGRRNRNDLCLEAQLAEGLLVVDEVHETVIFVLSLAYPRIAREGILRPYSDGTRSAVTSRYKREAHLGSTHRRYP